MQILLVFAGFIVLLLLRGSGEKTSIVGINRCDDLDWVLLALLVAFMIAMTAIAFFVQKHDFETKKKVHWHFLPGDYHFSFKTAVVFPVCGLIFSFTMFSTLCSTIISFLFRNMPRDYFLAGLIFSLIGSVPGIYLQSHVSKLTGRNQYSMMGFNLVIFACLVSITAYQSYILVLKEQNGLSLFKRNSYCIV